MSATTILAENEAVFEPVLWTVHGVNFHIHVPLNEFNSQFEAEMQAHEAATVAISVLKGTNTGLVVHLDENETEAALGPTMIVHPKDNKPTEGAFYPYTYEILANDGYYKDAHFMFGELVKETEKLKTQGAKIKEQNAALYKQLKNFEKLQQDLAKTKPKKKKRDQQPPDAPENPPK